MFYPAFLILVFKKELKEISVDKALRSLACIILAYHAIKGGIKNYILLNLLRIQSGSKEDKRYI